MSDNNSEKRIRELEELLRIEKEKNNQTISKRVPVCQICFEPVECPVTFNNNKNQKCKSSQCNPSCLLCVRKYIDNKIKNGETTFNCLSRCCTLEVGNPPCMVYGEIGRSLDDVPEPTLYRMMGGEGETQCRRCNTDCVTGYNLAKHIKNECSFRKVKCKCCKKIMLEKDLKKHEENCYFKCKWCDIRLPYLEKNQIHTQHYCTKKPIFLVNGLSYSLEEISNMYKNGRMHRDCMVSKYDSIHVSINSTQREQESSRRLSVFVNTEEDENERPHRISRPEMSKPPMRISGIGSVMMHLPHEIQSSWPRLTEERRLRNNDDINVDLDNHMA